MKAFSMSLRPEEDILYNVWIEIYYSVMTGHKKKWEACLYVVYMIS